MALKTIIKNISFKSIKRGKKSVKNGGKEENN